MNRRNTNRTLVAAALSVALTAVAADANKAAAPVAGHVPLAVTVAELDVVAPGFRATKLLKKDVYNDQDKKIGKVEDFIIAPDGKLSLAIVDVGGFLGLGKHPVAVNVDKFTEIHPKMVLPGATKEELKAMPKFEYAKEVAQR
jgi:sporulation protein YlmC with PRC-barrel domain